MQSDILDQVHKLLSPIAELGHCYDDGEDYNPGDNGNYDDAWEDGDTHGRVDLARGILTMMTSLGYQPH